MMSIATRTEIRILAAPWAVVMIACFASLAIRNWFGDLVFLAGVPFLAAYSWGYEFQNRTVSLLLSQPTDRMKLWRQKSQLSVIAVLIATIPYVLYTIDRSYNRQFAAPDLWYSVLQNVSNP